MYNCVHCILEPEIKIDSNNIVNNNMTEYEEEIKQCTEKIRQAERDYHKLNEVLDIIKHIRCPIVKKDIQLYKNRLRSDIEYNIQHINRLNNLLDLRDFVNPDEIEDY